jgi:hypothetical protein
VVAESSRFNPVAVIAHLLAIAAGLYLGFVAMDAIAPDLPGDDVAPGVSSSTVPRDVAGDDPDSLFRAAALAPALDQLEEQLPAGEGIVSLLIEPGGVSADTASADGLFELGDVSADTPSRMIGAIHRQRGAITAHDIGSMELVATADGPQWYVQVDIFLTDVDPPWTYGAPLEGKPLSVGGAPPEPVSG